MLKIGILTKQDGYRRRACDFYPIIKWERNLRLSGLSLEFINNHKNRKLFFKDVVIIDHRYYRDLIVSKGTYNSKEFVIQLISRLKKIDVKVILFDNGDGAGAGSGT